MSKVFVLFVCFHFCASQHLYSNRVKISSPSGPTKMELPTSLKQNKNNFEPQLQIKINSECKALHLPYMKPIEGKSCIFPFVLNGKVYNGCIRFFFHLLIAFVSIFCLARMRCMKNGIPPSASPSGLFLSPHCKPIPCNENRVFPV